MKQYDFYIVPTPIGNLGDITKRAIDVLKSVDIIACEDIRVTQKLLNHFDIKTKCISYHKFNEKERINKFLEILGEGKKIALVSDAGTPLICDPGAVVVDELRKYGFKITALAGANAVVTFLSQIPREDEQFKFIGFMPKNEQQIVQIISENQNTDLVFYESPNRILKTLKLIQSTFPSVKIAVGRELTKMFEEVIIDNVENILTYFETTVPKGEFVCLIYRNMKQTGNYDLDKKIKKLQKKNFKAKEISVILSELYDLNKNEVYKRILEL